jgi:hypothetical protein
MYIKTSVYNKILRRGKNMIHKLILIAHNSEELIVQTSKELVLYENRPISLFIFRLRKLKLVRNFLNGSFVQAIKLAKVSPLPLSYLSKGIRSYAAFIVMKEGLKKYTINIKGEKSLEQKKSSAIGKILRKLGYCLVVIAFLALVFLDIQVGLGVMKYLGKILELVEPFIYKIIRISFRMMYHTLKYLIEKLKFLLDPPPFYADPPPFYAPDA